MGSKLKAVLIFLAGATAGSLATYYLVREKFRIQADEEIEGIRELYRNRETADIKDMRESEGIVTESPEELRDYYIERLREDFGYDIQIRDDDEDEYEEVNPIEYPDDIEQVDESEFFNGFEDYESTSLKLYLLDKVALDEVEDIVPDLTRWVGDVDYDSLQPGDLYFINHPLMLKVELSVCNQSYKREVLGEDDDNESLGDFADN